MVPPPWYYGRTIGEKYGQNKRLLMAVLKGNEDPRWVGFVEKALDNRIPPRLNIYIKPFLGTEEQKAVLRGLIDTIKRMGPGP